MFTTSAFAIRATEIFPSSVVGKTNIKGTLACMQDGVEVNCDITNRVKSNEAPDIVWPDFDKKDKKTDIYYKDSLNTSVDVPSGESKTIDPGVYNRINVDGTLILNPGVYYIEEYTVSGKALPGDFIDIHHEGTVTLLVKSVLDLTGSLNNYIVGGNPESHQNYPNRYVLYTEASNAKVDNAYISGYIYFKESLSMTQMNLWGAVSAKSIDVANTFKVNVDLDHLIFTDFDTFLEVGPQMTAGWHMVKAPAEINENQIVTVEDFFGDDLDTSTFRTDWRVYERNYSGSGSYYTELDDLNMTLDRNRGYWLGIKKDAELKVLGLNPVVWDRKIEGCPTKNKGCYRYTLQRCAEGDTSPYLYNLIGSVGSIESDWKDYRIEVDKNGTLMTPTGAMEAGIINNQIWKYAPSATGTYLTGDDVGNGDSTIDYFEGFWVEVNCTNRIGETIDLIIPNGIVEVK